MCGRYVQTTPPAALARLFRTVNPAPNRPPSWNVAPTQDGLVVRYNPKTGTRHLDPLRWGLVPPWAKDAAVGSRMINARGETLAGKPAFRDAFHRSRCLVPIEAFYEWRPLPGGGKTKQPYAVALASGAPMALAGLWAGWRAPDGTILRTFTIVTTDANPRLALLHGRMPLVVAEEDWPIWLGEAEGDPAALIRPFPAEAFAIWPVSTRVNHVRANDPTLLAPLIGVDPVPGLGEATGPPPALATTLAMDVASD